MPTGTVKWLNPTKGYGFIQPQGGGKDVFVHISAVERAGLRSLNEGQAIEFELVSSRGKTSAENLRRRATLTNLPRLREAAPLYWHVTPSSCNTIRAAVETSATSRCPSVARRRIERRLRLATIRRTRLERALARSGITPKVIEHLPEGDEVQR